MISPHFSSISDFLAMGGYGVYVWPAYGIVLLVGVMQIVWVVR